MIPNSDSPRAIIANIAEYFERLRKMMQEYYDRWLAAHRFYVTKLVANDATRSDYFGYSVALENNVALIGANFKDAAGAAYIFTGSRDTWSQQARLPPGGPYGGLYFGESVALSGNTALVGQLDDDGILPIAGAAFVFTGSGASWDKQATLTANDAQEEDYFGAAAALCGDTALVGAPNQNDNRGAAYVFTRSGTIWSQQSKLLPGDPTPPQTSAFDDFGGAVALDGDTALIGAHGLRAAYVFTRSGNAWTQQAKLVPNDACSSFGWSIALCGDTALVGTSIWNKAYVFTRSAGNWSQQAVLTSPPGITTGRFGHSVAVFNNTAVVCDDQASVNNGTCNGAAYVFTRSGTTWSYKRTLNAPDPIAFDSLGSSVALKSNTALVGAPYKDHNTGVVYVFDNIA
jgi:hypothetical protein